jgi:hypothetical protein
MQLTPLDGEHRLWLVEDILSEEQMKDIVSIDWPSLSWKRGCMQEHWKRRQIHDDNPDIQRISKYVPVLLPKINTALGTQFKRTWCMWWLDEPGFTCDMHTDGHLPNAMQIYWLAPSEDYGTVFYHYRDPSHVKHKFLSRPNQGYLMLNHANEDGSQPLQWHNMPNPVPEGTWRLSSYWFFEL